MYNCTYFNVFDIGNGSGMRSILSHFGLYILILRCNRGVAGPLVSLARLMQSMVTLELLMTYF